MDKAIVANSRPFSSRLGKGTILEKDSPILMEFDPSSPYEGAVKDFAQENLANGGQVLAFTSRASPVMSQMKADSGISLYILSDGGSTDASYAASQKAVIAHYEPDLILNSLSQGLKAEPAGSKSVIFDNLSDMLLAIGVEKTYKFAKKANEMLFESGASCLFLLIGGAHDDRTRSVVESVFRRIILFDREGMKVKK